jgi:hypothetical protein
MITKIGGVFGTLTYPDLILPYSVSASIWPPSADKKHLQVPEPPIN